MQIAESIQILLNNLALIITSKFKVGVNILLLVSGFSIFCNPAQAAIGCNVKDPFVRKTAFIEGLDLYDDNPKYKAWIDAKNQGSKIHEMWSTDQFPNWNVSINFPEGHGMGTPAGVQDGTSIKWFVVGLDHAIWSNNGVQNWESWGGIATSNPAVINVGSSSEVFVRGADNAIWTRTSWNKWQYLGGISLGAPIVLANGNNGGVQVRVCGVDNKIWVRYRRTYAPGYWGPWVHLGGD